MAYEITPEPDEETRRAILSALAEEDSERRQTSAWAEQLLPRRDDDEQTPEA